MIKNSKYYGKIGDQDTAPNGFHGLMDFVCPTMGYCGSVIDGKPRHVCALLPEFGTVSSDEFVDFLFEAEGIPREHWNDSHRQKIKEAFRKHMGKDEVRAECLDWDR